MKLKAIDRIMLALYAILGMLSLVLLGACVLCPGGYAFAVADMLVEVCDGTPAKAFGCVLIVALLSGLVYLMALALRRETRGSKNTVSVQNTDSGAVRVSIQAMDALVRRAIGSQEGVLDVKSRIINHDDSVTVQIDMALAVDAHIPNITMMMQRRIKRYIEETSGIAVREVVVLVSEVREGDSTASLPPVQALCEAVESGEAECEPADDPASVDEIAPEAVEAVCGEGCEAAAEEAEAAWETAGEINEETEEEIIEADGQPWEPDAQEPAEEAESTESTESTDAPQENEGSDAAESNEA